MNVMLYDLNGNLHELTIAPVPSIIDDDYVEYHVEESDWIYIRFPYKNKYAVGMNVHGPIVLTKALYGIPVTKFVQDAKMMAENMKNANEKEGEDLALSFIKNVK